MNSFALLLGEMDADLAHALSSFTVDVSSCGVVVTSATLDDCPIVYTNPAFLAMTGYAEEEVLGRNCRFMQGADRSQPHRELMRSALKAQQAVTVELRNYRKDGTLFWCCLTMTPFRNEAGCVTHFIGMQTDITARKMSEEALAFQSTHDAQTGLPNRILLQRELGEWMCDSTLAAAGLTIAALEINQFMNLCAGIDNRAAETVVHAVAEQIQGCLNDGELLARHSAGGFSIVMKGAAQDTVSARCLEIQRAVSRAIQLPVQTLYLSSSMGVALFPRDGRNAENLVRFADMALSQVGESGCNAYQFYADDMTRRMRDRLALVAALRAAISNGELCVYYQPQVELNTGKVIGCEALARWYSPTYGQVVPDVFIPIAEETGLIDEIGAWVLERALSDLAARRAAGLPSIAVAVNVSPVQLRDPRLADRIDELLKTWDVTSDLLVLEVTEAVLMEDTPASKSNLARLQALGIGLALDDFGTGYSSLSYLKRIPFKKVKIDHSFVQEVIEDADDAAIVKAIISMAHTLGIVVVAEGVETEAQCTFLRECMCNEIQGFLFSKPLPVAEFNAFLATAPSLPAHLLESKKPLRTLLIVDDEINIVASLRRLLRRDEYLILTANSGAEGLALLETNPVDVILSDQRMPGMTGVEFLSIAKIRFPDTVRLVLSGYTELQSVTDAINEGAIYKFLTKPWDDAKLRGHIQEAFQRKELADEVQRLTRQVYKANQELAAANRQQHELLDLKQQQIMRDASSLQIVREALQHISLAVVAVDDCDMIAFANDAAVRLLSERGFLLGGDARALLPELFSCPALPAPSDLSAPSVTSGHPVQLDGKQYRLCCHAMGKGSDSRGRLLTMAPIHFEEQTL